MFKVNGVRVEGLKELDNGGGGDRPGGLVELGAKFVGPRTRIDVHTMEGKLNFGGLKGGCKMIKLHLGTSVKIINVKGPTGFPRLTQEADIGVEHRSLLVMVMQLTTSMFNNLNLVPTMALIGTCMEITSVLIPLNGHSHLTSLLPKGELGMSGSA